MVLMNDDKPLNELEAETLNRLITARVSRRFWNAGRHTVRAEATIETFGVADVVNEAWSRCLDRPAFRLFPAMQQRYGYLHSAANHVISNRFRMESQREKALTKNWSKPLVYGSAVRACDVWDTIADVLTGGDRGGSMGFMSYGPYVSRFSVRSWPFGQCHRSKAEFLTSVFYGAVKTELSDRCSRCECRCCHHLWRFCRHCDGCLVDRWRDVV
jgi:hypothetical protein